jgi:hypothetical protein
VDGRTRNGDIVSDFPLNISGDESKTVSGKIGGGQAKIALNTDVGDVRIKRGDQSQGLVPAVPKMPAAPKTPKAPKAAPAEPVEQ